MSVNVRKRHIRACFAVFGRRSMAVDTRQFGIWLAPDGKCSLGNYSNPHTVNRAPFRIRGQKRTTKKGALTRRPGPQFLGEMPRGRGSHEGGWTAGGTSKPCDH